MSEAIVEFKDVTFSYNGRSALEHVSTHIDRGDYVGLIGPNGAGKTTLVKILLGLLQPKSGTVKLFGKDIRKFKDWHKIGYVQQKATNFDPTFPVTVREVVAMGRFAVRGAGRLLGARDHDMINDAIEMVGIYSLAHHHIGELSGGQQQKVFIARALASEPELLILDEPTTGVDANSQHEFYHFLHDLNSHHNLTLILISHDTDIVSTHVSKLLCINRTLMDKGCNLGFLTTHKHTHGGGGKEHELFKKVTHKH